MKVAVIFYHKGINTLYKREWIDKCVESIKDQTFQDFDVFELNYGDTSHKYCEPILCQNYYFIRIILKNHIEAMNYLYSRLFLQEGYDVIFNTNMDDYYDVKRFEKQLVKIREGYQLVSSNFTYIDEQGKAFKKMAMAGKDIAKNLRLNHNVIAHPCIAMHKSFWEFRFKELLGREDLDLWKRAIAKGKKFFILEDYLLMYRIHSNQVTKKYK